MTPAMGMILSLGCRVAVKPRRVVSSGRSLSRAEDLPPRDELST